MKNKKSIKNILNVYGLETQGYTVSYVGNYYIEYEMDGTNIKHRLNDFLISHDYKSDHIVIDLDKVLTPGIAAVCLLLGLNLDSEILNIYIPIQLTEVLTIYNAMVENYRDSDYRMVDNISNVSGDLFDILMVELYRTNSVLIQRYDTFVRILKNRILNGYGISDYIMNLMDKLSMDSFKLINKLPRIIYIFDLLKELNMENSELWERFKTRYSNIIIKIMNTGKVMNKVQLDLDRQFLLSVVPYPDYLNKEAYDIVFNFLEDTKYIIKDKINDKN